jgi:heat shock protein HslJ
MKLLITMLMLTALVAGGCRGSGEGNDPEQLAGRTWRLQDMAGTAVPADVVITAVFSSDEVKGNGGCNDYFSACKFDGGNVSFGPVGATKKFCDGPAGTLENVYFDVLKSSVRWLLLDDGRLQLVRADGEALTFGPAGKAE